MDDDHFIDNPLAVWGTDPDCENITKTKDMKTTDATKRQMQALYANACNMYLTELLRMWELDARYGYWNSDQPGTIYHYGETHNLSMEDIIYCVENDIEEDEVLAWEDYCLNAMELNISYPNLRAWHHGCPRISQDQFDRIREMKDELDRAVEELKKKQE